STKREIFVLSIDPSHRGFGYAMLEGPQTLIDWGVKLAPGDKNAQCLIKIKELIAHYRPHVIVVEDCRASRRRPRVRRLTRSILMLARKQGVRTKCFARSKVNQAFSTAGSKTKHEMA